MLQNPKIFNCLLDGVTIFLFFRFFNKIFYRFFGNINSLFLYTYFLYTRGEIFSKKKRKKYCKIYKRRKKNEQKKANNFVKKRVIFFSFSAIKNLWIWEHFLNDVLDFRLIGHLGENTKKNRNFL